MFRLIRGLERTNAHVANVLAVRETKKVRLATKEGLDQSVTCASFQSPLQRLIITSKAERKRNYILLLFLPDSWNSIVSCSAPPPTFRWYSPPLRSEPSGDMRTSKLCRACLARYRKKGMAATTAATVTLSAPRVAQIDQTLRENRWKDTAESNAGGQPRHQSRWRRMIIPLLIPWKHLPYPPACLWYSLPLPVAREARRSARRIGDRCRGGSKRTGWQKTGRFCTASATKVIRLGR